MDELLRLYESGSVTPPVGLDAEIVMLSACGERISKQAWMNSLSEKIQN